MKYIIKLLAITKMLSNTVDLITSPYHTVKNKNKDKIKSKKKNINVK